MTALGKGRLTKERANRARRFPVAAGVVCWQGGLVGVKPGAAPGALKALPMSTDGTLKCVGVADASADNRVGGEGAVGVNVSTGTFLFAVDAADPVTAQDVGATVYASDDQTVCRTAGTKPFVGVLFDIDPSGDAWIVIR